MTLEASLVSPDAHGVGPELRLHGERFLPGLRSLVRGAAAVRHPARDPALASGAADAARRADRPVGGSALEADAGAARADGRGDPRLRRLVCALGGDLARGGLRLRGGARRALLPAVRVHLAAVEPARGRVWRPARESRALPARDRPRDPRPLRRRLPDLVPDQRRGGRRGRLHARRLDPGRAAGSRRPASTRSASPPATGTRCT